MFDFNYIKDNITLTNYKQNTKENYLFKIMKYCFN